MIHLFCREYFICINEEIWIEELLLKLSHKRIQNTFTIRIYQQCVPANMFLAKKIRLFQNSVDISFLLQFFRTKWKQKNSSRVNYLILLLQTKYSVTHCLCGDTVLIPSLINVKYSKFKTIYINVELTALISAPN